MLRRFIDAAQHVLPAILGCMPNSIKVEIEAVSAVPGEMIRGAAFMASFGLAIMIEVQLVFSEAQIT